MVDLGRRIRVGMDIGYLFEVEGRLKGGGVVVGRREIKEVGGIGVYVGEVVDFVRKWEEMFYI